MTLPIFAIKTPTEYVFTEYYDNIDYINRIIKLNTSHKNYDKENMIWPNEITKLAHIRNNIKNGKATITYRKKEYGYGRFYATTTSLQCLYGILRKKFINGKLEELDITSAHQSILLQIADHFGFDAINIKKYVTNKNDILSKHMQQYNINKDKAKALFLRLTYGGTFDGFIRDEKIRGAIPTTFIKSFQDEMIDIKDTLIQKYPDFKLYIDIADNIKGKRKNKIHFSALALFLQELESRIMSQVIDKLRELNITISIFIHDGVYIKSDTIIPDLLSTIKSYVYNNTGIMCDFAIKSTQLEPEDIEYLELHEPFISEEKIGKNEYDQDILNILSDNCSESAISNFVEKYYKDTIKIYNGKLFNFNGNRWIINNEYEYLYGLIRDDINNILSIKLGEYYDIILDEKRIADLKRHIIYAKKNHSINTCIKDILDLGKLTINKDIFDLNPYLIGFDNGVYDLKSGIFRTGNCSDFVSLSVGYDYIPVDNTDLAMDYIAKVFPIANEREFMLSFLSTALSGINVRNFGILTGQGQNSKSILLDIMNNMLGDYAYKCHVDILLQQMKIGACPELANIHKKRLVYFNEPSRHKTIIGSTIKDLVSNETSGGINSRQLYSSDTHVANHGTYFVLCNKIPDIDDTSDAVYDRLIVCPFRSLFKPVAELHKYSGIDHVFPQDYRVTTHKFRVDIRLQLFHILANKLYEFINLNNETLINIPASFTEKTEEYLQDSNDLNSWFRGLYEYRDDYKGCVTMKEVYRAFTASSYYDNLTKLSKRKMNIKKLLAELCDNPNIRPHYRDRYRPTIDDYQYNYRNCFVGYARIKSDNDTEIVSDTEL